MNIKFTTNAWEDYLYWQNINKSILNKINSLLKDVTRDPFNGIGKPEPLKFQVAGYWSRRISGEHRLVYQIANPDLIVISCRYQYE